MAFSMSNLIEKLNARDKDERYMAMHDLAADLDRDNIKLENEMERRVVSTILKHLEDSSTDVKQQAVRTIASLARKVQEDRLEEIADRLATHIINKTDEEKRDIGSIGLKTLVGVLTQQTAPSVLKRVTPKLQQGIQLDAEVAHYCLEILNDLLKNFGMIMARDLASIQSGILPMLSSPVAATRKRVSTCVASLAICAPEQLFATLVGTIFNNIETAKTADEIRTYIQTVAGISRSVGHRLGRELKRIIPLFMTFCNNPKYTEDTEMLENCLQVRTIASAPLPVLSRNLVGKVGVRLPLPGQERARVALKCTQISGLTGPACAVGTASARAAQFSRCRPWDMAARFDYVECAGVRVFCAAVPEGDHTASRGDREHRACLYQARPQLRARGRRRPDGGGRRGRGGRVQRRRRLQRVCPSLM